MAVPIIYLHAFRRERSRSCYLAVSISVYTFLIDLMKLLYAQPRPFMSSDDVQAFYCSAQYGHPSGHSMIGVGFTLLVALDTIKANNV